MDIDLGVKEREGIEAEVIFLVMTEIKDRLCSIEERIETGEFDAHQEKSMKRFASHLNENLENKRGG